MKKTNRGKTKKQTHGLICWNCIEWLVKFVTIKLQI